MKRAITLFAALLAAALVAGSAVAPAASAQTRTKDFPFTICVQNKVGVPATVQVDIPSGRHKHTLNDPSHYTCYAHIHRSHPDRVNLLLHTTFNGPGEHSAWVLGMDTNFGDGVFVEVGSGACHAMNNLPTLGSVVTATCGKVTGSVIYYGKRGTEPEYRMVLEAAS